MIDAAVNSSAKEYLSQKRGRQQLERSKPKPERQRRERGHIEEMGTGSKPATGFYDLGGSPSFRKEGYKMNITFLASDPEAGVGAGAVIGLLMLGLWVLGIVWSIVAFFVPFMIWKILRRLTNIQNVLQGQATRSTGPGNLGILKSPFEKSAPQPTALHLPEKPLSTKEPEFDVQAWNRNFGPKSLAPEERLK